MWAVQTVADIMEDGELSWVSCDTRLRWVTDRVSGMMSWQMQNWQWQFSKVTWAVQTVADIKEDGELLRESCDTWLHRIVNEISMDNIATHGKWWWQFSEMMWAVQTAENTTDYRKVWGVLQQLATWTTDGSIPLRWCGCPDLWMTCKVCLPGQFFASETPQQLLCTCGKKQNCLQILLNNQKLSTPCTPQKQWLTFVVMPQICNQIVGVSNISMWHNGT